MRKVQAVKLNRNNYYLSALRAQGAVKLVGNIICLHCVHKVLSSNSLKYYLSPLRSQGAVKLFGNIICLHCLHKVLSS